MALNLTVPSTPIGPKQVVLLGTVLPVSGETMEALTVATLDPAEPMKELGTSIMRTAAVMNGFNWRVDTFVRVESVTYITPTA